MLLIQDGFIFSQQISICEYCGFIENFPQIEPKENEWTIFILLLLSAFGFGCRVSCFPCEVKSIIICSFNRVHPNKIWTNKELVWYDVCV